MNDEQRVVRNRVFDDDYVRLKQKKKSKLHERRFAKKVKGSRQPLSGAGERAKGDVSNELQLFELKRTGKASLRIYCDWIEKISIEARAVGKVPGFGFTFDALTNEMLVPRDWVAVPVEFLRELQEAADERSNRDGKKTG